MAKVHDPILFSKHFGIEGGELSRAGLIDPFLNVDTQLFIDPILLSKSANQIIRDEASIAFREHFTNLIKLLGISKTEGDPAWRGARRLLDLHEPAETGLGYGGSGRSGSSRPDEIREAILKTTKQIIELGCEDPEMLALMGFFEENVGPDTISDFTTRVIAKQLAKITQAFCIEHKIPIRKQNKDDDFSLPYYVSRNQIEKPTILVPRDIVRDLPVANDWSDLDKAVQANKRIRDRVNILLAGIAKPTVTDRKEALRQATTQSAELFQVFLEAVKEFTSHYDPNKDALGYYELKNILRSDLRRFKSNKQYDLAKGIDEIVEVVHETLSMFKHHIENGNLWEQLWIDKVPKRERAAQLIYYAIADCFCIANDIDISPEANMGGGPIDFKFSRGYNARVLVEIKKSSGTVCHGYEKQLEHYKKAARSFRGIFVVLNFGDLGNKLKTIYKIRDQRLANGEPASEIVVIDATPKKSASKKK